MSKEDKEFARKRIVRIAVGIILAPFVIFVTNPLLTALQKDFGKDMVCALQFTIPFEAIAIVSVMFILYRRSVLIKTQQHISINIFE